LYFRTEEFAIVEKNNNSTAANIKEKLFYGNHYKLKLNIAGDDLDIIVRNTSFSVGQGVSIEFNSSHN